MSFSKKDKHGLFYFIVQEKWKCKPFTSMDEANTQSTIIIDLDQGDTAYLAEREFPITEGKWTFMVPDDCELFRYYASGGAHLGNFFQAIMPSFFEGKDMGQF